ncbi:MAG: L,D-transpeptidase [Bacteroidetes bacterium]|nr:L,D-transpeptidase [Bacteroidota bacterium]
MGTKKIFLFSLLALSLFSFRDTNSRNVKKNIFHRTLNTEGDVYVIIVKSDYELKVYDKEGWYATYPVVFGSKSLEDKMLEGDRKTPEGLYHIVIKKPDAKWDKMMLLDYPTKADYDKFKLRKAQGLIPKNAKIGNGIGIHGTWNHDDMAIDLYQNWTNGCISLKREDVEELYDLLPIGTKVIIQK